MESTTAEPGASHNGRSLTLLSVVVAVAALRFARAFVIPVVLAILMAFVLAPLANLLGKMGFRRTLATITVVVLSLVVLGALGFLIASQLGDLAHQLPGYQQNIHKKIQSIRSSGGGFMQRLSKISQQITEELAPQPPDGKNATGEVKPVPVEVRQSPFSPLQLIHTVLNSVVEVIVVFAVVIVFVVFMLSQREDLRKRLLLLGKARQSPGTPNPTGKMLDEAAERVSRYLLAQLAVNSGYGLMAGVATYFVGVPNPLLWGVLAAILRYVPYLGIWAAAAMPAAVALAIDPGFAKALVLVSLYVGIDVVMYNFVEPFLYGRTTGLTPLAVLAAALFWTWLWGPVGLLLSTPLTVCVVVLGRNVPDLSFISILLSDEPQATQPGRRWYHRHIPEPHKNT